MRSAASSRVRSAPDDTRISIGAAQRALRSGRKARQGDLTPQGWPDESAANRRATMSISISAPRARPLTPKQVRAGRRPGGK